MDGLIINVVNGKITPLKGPDGISPSLDGTVDQATIHPGSDLIQLHPGVVGMVTGSKVVAVAEERDEAIGTTVWIIKCMALGNSHVLILWDASRSLCIQHLLNHLLTCRWCEIFNDIEWILPYSGKISSEK